MPRKLISISLTIALASSGLFACKKARSTARIKVARLFLSPRSTENQAVAKLGKAEILAMIERLFAKDGRFERVGEHEPGVTLRAELLLAERDGGKLKDGGAAGHRGEAVAMIKIETADGDTVGATANSESTLPDQGPTRPAFDALAERATLAALGRVGRQVELASASSDALLKLLDDRDRDTRGYAVRLLGERKEKRATAKLIAMLKTTEGDALGAVVGALVSIGDRAAVPALIAQTKRKDAVFLTSIIQALATLGGADAEAYLFTLSTGHPSEYIQRTAEDALKAMAQRSRVTAKRERVYN